MIIASTGSVFTGCGLSVNLPTAALRSGAQSVLLLLLCILEVITQVHLLMLNTRVTLQLAGGVDDY